MSHQPLKSWSEQDLPADLLAGEVIAVIGYGNQGHAHAHNLRASGASVIVGARPGGLGHQAAKEAGFEVVDIADAAARADLVMLTTPDEVQPALYRDVLEKALRPGSALLFAHGLAIHYNLIQPRPDIDIILAAPKGPGHQLKRLFDEGLGLVCLIAVAQNASGRAENRALGYAQALGSGRAAILETSFGDECQTDMFGEQAVLCGGVSNLVLAGFETLVDAGYPEELAYFECLHEVKLVVDLMHERGLAGMREAISNTAEFGDYKSGERVVGPAARAAMKDVLDDIRSGRFVDALMADVADDYAYMEKRRKATRAHAIERVGKGLRKLMPWMPPDA